MANARQCGQWKKVREREGGGDDHSTDTDVITYTACSLYSLLVLPDVNHLDWILAVTSNNYSCFAGFPTHVKYYG